MEKILFCNLDLLKRTFDGNDNTTLHRIRNSIFKLC